MDTSPVSISRLSEVLSAQLPWAHRQVMDLVFTCDEVPQTVIQHGSTLIEIVSETPTYYRIDNVSPTGTATSYIDREVGILHNLSMTDLLDLKALC